jgi:ABC-type phosphate/phosphonate transport system substrate-binding protein
VIGKTIRVPEGPFVASLQAPAELREKMKHYLIEHVKTKKVVLGVLGVSGFAEPIDPEEYQPYFELRRKLHSSASPATKPASASTKPAV